MFRAFLLASLLSASAPAYADWNRSETDHFIVYSKQTPKKLRSIAERLERFDAAMRKLNNMPQSGDSPSNRVTIFLVSSPIEFTRLTGRVGLRYSAFYQPGVGNSHIVAPRELPVERRGLPQLKSTAEMGALLGMYNRHLLARRTSGVLPEWLDVGTGQFGAATRFSEDGSVEIGQPAAVWALTLWDRGDVPVASLLARDFAPLGLEADAVNAAHSWLLTHFLTFSKPRRGQLANYVARLNAGEKTHAAAEAAFGDLQQLSAEVEKYLATDQFPFLRVPPDMLTTGPVKVEPVSAGQSAMIPVYLRMLSGTPGINAQTLAARARKIAARHPNDPFVLRVLAEALMAAGDHAGAEAAAERAVAAAPESVEALIVRSWVALSRLAEAARTAKSPDAAPTPAEWDAARRWVVQASLIEPDAPLALLTTYRSYRHQGIDPPRHVIEALYRAAELSPESRSGLGLTLAGEYLAEGRTADARRALTPLAFDPRDTRYAAFATRLVAAIDSNDRSETMRLARLIDLRLGCLVSEVAGTATDPRSICGQSGFASRHGSSRSCSSASKAALRSSPQA